MLAGPLFLAWLAAALAPPPYHHETRTRSSSFSWRALLLLPAVHALMGGSAACMAAVLALDQSRPHGRKARGFWSVRKASAAAHQLLEPETKRKRLYLFELTPLQKLTLSSPSPLPLKENASFGFSGRSKSSLGQRWENRASSCTLPSDSAASDDLLLHFSFPLLNDEDMEMPSGMPSWPVCAPGLGAAARLGLLGASAARASLCGAGAEGSGGAGSALAASQACASACREAWLAISCTTGWERPSSVAGGGWAWAGDCPVWVESRPPFPPTPFCVFFFPILFSFKYLNRLVLRQFPGFRGCDIRATRRGPRDAVS